MARIKTWRHERVALDPVDRCLLVIQHMVSAYYAQVLAKRWGIALSVTGYLVLGDIQGHQLRMVPCFISLCGFFCGGFLWTSGRARAQVSELAMVGVVGRLGRGDL